LTIVVPEKLVKETVHTIIKVNQTGKSGDGKIFVMPVQGSISVRTGEGGDSVLDDV
jgi:nitrogen regulatory protein PII 2